MKEKWERAMDKEAALIEDSKQVLQSLNRIIDDAINDLVRLVEDYSGLLPSGSFLVQVEEAVGLLEQVYKSMEEKYIGLERLQKLEESVDLMKKNLEHLRVAERQEVQVKNVRVIPKAKWRFSNVWE